MFELGERNTYWEVQLLGVPVVCFFKLGRQNFRIPTVNWTHRDTPIVQQEKKNIFLVQSFNTTQWMKRSLCFPPPPARTSPSSPPTPPTSARTPLVAPPAAAGARRASSPTATTTSPRTASAWTRTATCPWRAAGPTCPTRRTWSGEPEAGLNSDPFGRRRERLSWGHRLRPIGARLSGLVRQAPESCKFFSGDFSCARWCHPSLLLGDALCYGMFEHKHAAAGKLMSKSCRAAALWWRFYHNSLSVS